MHNNINRKKQDLLACGIHSADLFRFIDLEDKGYITADCMNHVLKEKNVFCDPKDLKCLMRVFRKKVDEPITIYEFQEFMEVY